MLYVNKEIYQKPKFETCLLDADSIMYLISWKETNQKAAQRGLEDYVASIIEAVEVPEAYVYVKGKDNFRYQIDPEYKANRRKSMDPEVLDRVEQLYAYAKSIYINSDGAEADDYVSVHAYDLMAQGKEFVIAHIDKDLNMIPGWHYNFQKKEFYFVAPEESFTFMMRQLMMGDMSADNIPGLKGIGEVTTSKMLHGFHLSQMKDYIIRLWKTNHGKGSNDDPGWVKYNTPEKRYQRFLDSANCLILRESADELRPLTEEEILKKMTWSDPDTDFRFHHERDVSDMILMNSVPINCYTKGGPRRPCREDLNHKEPTPDTGETEPDTQSSTQKNTSDSSTE